MLASVVTIEPWVSHDGYGAATYGTAVEYQCRVVGRNRMIRAFDGNERLSTVQVYLSSIPTVPVVGPKDRVTLPEDHIPQQPPIMAILRETDEDGPHHLVLYT